VDSLVHFWLHFDGAPPLMAHGCGEDLRLSSTELYAGYDMQEYGEVRVASAEPPDLLAEWVGRRLLDAAIIQGYGSPVGGVRLRFEHGDLVVATLGDEWVLARDRIAPECAAYLTVGEWMVGGAQGGDRPPS
jgi:hypothetical protein